MTGRPIPLTRPAETSRRRTSPALDAIDDEKLLALILSFAGRPRGLAADLVARFGTAGDVLSADASELQRAAGGDPDVEGLIAAIRELAIRAARETIGDRSVITSWSQLLAYVRTVIACLPREQFRALYLDRRNCLIREEWIADGTVDHAPVYNSGPARVARLGRVPAIRETQAYVESVLNCFLALTAGQRVANSVQCRPRERAL